MAAITVENVNSHSNGIVDVDSGGDFDEDDKSKLRPVDIDADVREMGRRKRVDLIMNSRLFREELERIIETQMRDGNSSTGGLLQQISDMVGAKYASVSNSSNFASKNSCAAIAINDIRGIEGMGYTKGEKVLRCKLAALFRLIELYGWSRNLNHVTARLDQQEEHFLVNAFGLLYNEITASSLVKVDIRGNVVESGTTNFTANANGFKLHAAIYAARPDIGCIAHLQTPAVLAVSSLKCGLLSVCQEAAVVGDVSYHTYLAGMATEAEERDKLARNLGPNNKVIFLTNYGALCCGETIEETFFYLYNTASACETQLKIAPFGKENVTLLPEETRKMMYDAIREAPVAPVIHDQSTTQEKPCRLGVLEFEALMRMLDNAGFRSGYIYRQPLIKNELPRPRMDVEVPPAVSSLGYLLDEEQFYKQGVWKKQHGGGTKGNERIRWLNSPNVYQRVDVVESGTTDPKKITKWVDANNEEWITEGNLSHTSTPVKIENASQFVPQNTNPKELKKLQKQMKVNKRADKVASGPQSQVLEGSASKGIIQRGFQRNANVNRTPHAKNSSDAVTSEQLENYKKDVTCKRKTGSYHDEDESDDGLLNDMRLIQIETRMAPKADQAEVVMSDGENTYNGEQTTFSTSSKEDSVSKDVSTEDSSQKGKKKKKGLRTPSFLRKKKEKKKQESEA